MREHSHARATRALKKVLLVEGEVVGPDYSSAARDRADEKLSQAALFFVPDCSTMRGVGCKI
jgi:hypothetical protein